MDPRPIGVFDSGVGGLTVLRAIARQLPEERLVYVGDTARVPYGPRGVKTIAGFAMELAQFLLDQDVKAIVIACNTVSATCADQVRRLAGGIPVVDVIGPTVGEAIRRTQTGVIGAIGTVSTIRSGVYEAAARRLRPDVRVLGRACPLFVPIAEEDLQDHPVADLMAGEYLGSLKDSELDALILGCTHYPLLRRPIGRVLGESVSLIDSAEPTAAALEEVLETRGLRGDGPGSARFYVTDASYKFIQIAGAIMGSDVTELLHSIELPSALPDRP